MQQPDVKVAFCFSCCFGRWIRDSKSSTFTTAVLKKNGRYVSRFEPTLSLLRPSRQQVGVWRASKGPTEREPAEPHPSETKLKSRAADNSQ